MSAMIWAWLLILAGTSYAHRHYATLGDDESIPYHVNLDFVGRSGCAGVILSEDWILTAAHCLVDETYDYLTVERSNAGKKIKEVHKIAKIYIHKDFDFHPIEDDIGLIKLQSPLKFGKKQKSITIRSAPLTNGVLVTTFALDKTYDSLLYELVEEPVVNVKLCQNKWNSLRKEIKVVENNICLGIEEETHNRRDSGTPAFDENGNLVGLMLFKPLEGYPVVLTNVTAYRDWIQTKTHLANIFV